MSQQQIVVGGSWVDLLQQAQRMAQQFNDNAIPAFVKIIDGLSRLPQAQLQRGDFLLAGLRSDAAVALEAYLCSRGRIADALAVVQRGMTWPMHPDDLHAWEARALQMHLLLKQTDAASAIVHRRIAAGQDAVALLSELAELQIWFGLPAEAEQTIGELERAVNRNQDPATMRRARATLAWTRTRLSLQQRKWNDALAWYEHCCTLEATFREHSHVLYEPMVRAGQAELALPLIDGERKQPMRAALWRGLAQKVLGQTEQAQATWLRAAKTSLTEQKSNPGFVEWIHCFYYSGDPKGEALTMLLTAQREEANLPWSIYLATALGSALRNNMDAAHLQMRLATRALRINLDGLLLPAQSRYHFDNLLSAEQMAGLQPYFVNENQ